MGATVEHPVRTKQDACQVFDTPQPAAERITLWIGHKHDMLCPSASRGWGWLWKTVKVQMAYV